MTLSDASPDNGTPRTNDARLLPFLNAPDGAESERLLASLVPGYAEPLVKSIVGYKLRLAHGAADSDDAEDVCNDVSLRLVARLRALKENPGAECVADFRGYVAVAAYHACHEHLREKYPRRHRLKNRLRYLLTHHADFALWRREDHAWACGFAAWRDTPETRPDADALSQDAARALSPLVTNDGEARAAELHKLLTALFRRTNQSIELDALVTFVAGVTGVRDHPSATEFDEERQGDDPARGDPVADDYDRRAYLARLWSEVCELPVRQRVALLLNLQDASGASHVEALPASGVASIRDIARALEMPAEDFARLWNELPLDDNTIAARLGATRQQIINLRKSARERLARRMKRFGT